MLVEIELFEARYKGYLFEFGDVLHPLMLHHDIVAPLGAFYGGVVVFLLALVEVLKFEGILYSVQDYLL